MASVVEAKDRDSIEPVQEVDVMRSIAPLRAAKIGYIVMSVLFCLLGVALLIWPNLSISLIGIIAGIMLIVFGLVKLAGYFTRDMYELAFQHDLAFGLLLIVLGVMLLVQPNRAMSFLCLILGVSIMADGLFKVQTAFDAKRFGVRSWWLILTLGVIAGGIGIVAAFHPAQSARVLTVLLGISMLAEGALNLSVALCALKVVRRYKDNVIEAEFEEDK